MSDPSNNQATPLDISSLSFDSFGRDPGRDVVCLAPIRTIVRREEEIVLVRKVRKVEDIEAAPACPVTSTTLSSSPLATNNQSTHQSTYSTPQPTAPYPPQQSVSQASPVYAPQPVYSGQVYSSPQSVTATQAEVYSAPQPIAEPMTGTEEELIVHSQRNCFYIDPAAMGRLQHQISVSRVLRPGTYTIKLKSGGFDYQIESGHPGEPIVLLWIYGGKVVNHKTGVEVGATWSSLNGYGDTLTLDVREPATLCGFFFDTYLDDNEGEVVVAVEGPGYSEDLTVHSKHNCYYIEPEAMRRLEQETSVSKTLQPATYAITLKSGSFGYRGNSGFEGEPIVLLWIYGGSLVNHKTGVEVGATWSSLNGHGDTLTLDVHQPVTVAAFFYDTYLEDNQGEVTLSVARI